MFPTPAVACSSPMLGTSKPNSVISTARIVAMVASLPPAAGVLGKQLVVDGERLRQVGHPRRRRRVEHEREVHPGAGIRLVTTGRMDAQVSAPQHVVGVG